MHDDVVVENIDDESTVGVLEITVRKIAKKVEQLKQVEIK